MTDHAAARRPPKHIMISSSWLLVSWLLLLSATGSTGRSLHHGHRVSARSAPLILTALPSITVDTVPASFDWRSVDGVSYVTADVNQHIPVYCGSCWIHGTLAALNDRIKIARKAAFPDVMLSRQAAMNCVPSLQALDEPPPGCDGGDPWDIHTYMAKSGTLPDETCQPYEAKNGQCDAAGQCRNCYHPSMIGDPDVPTVDFTSPGCFAVESGPRYGVREYGGVSGESNMQKEIYARGPIVCSIAADLTFLLSYPAHLIDGVYIDPSYFPADGSPSPHNASEIDHDVEITGWGTTASGIPYWVARNSWGTYWGERGWFKILRGSEHLFIESDCQWAVPDVSPLEANLQQHLVGDYSTGKQTASVNEDDSVVRRIMTLQAAQRREVASETSNLLLVGSDVPHAKAPAQGTAQMADTPRNGTLLNNWAWGAALALAVAIGVLAGRHSKQLGNPTRASSPADYVAFAPP